MRRWLVGGLVAALVVGGGLLAVVTISALRETVTPYLLPDICDASADGRSVQLTPQQAENAGLITAIAVARGLPARAASIALATAYQESGLRNLDHGDRDSLGLFQQRPSQGWGTAEQVMDPAYAAGAFYDRLVQIPGYRELEITVAAQEVQRSGFPEAYADHEGDARVLASALSGNSRHSFTCRITAPDGADGDLSLTSAGLTPRAQRVLDDVRTVFGDVPVGGFDPAGVSTGHREGSAHYEGRAVDVFVRPVSKANRTRGWAMAHYLVSQAQRLEIATVIFDGRIWTARRSAAGWRDYSPDTTGRDARTAAILEHRDHVHVDVA